MLMPKKVKFRKQQRGRMRGKAWRGSDVSFGDYGLKALECGWLTNRQIEAARVAMTRKIKRGGKVWINVFPDKPVTKKPAETRMGSGKGSPEGWVAVVKPGRVMFELAGVPEPLAREIDALRRRIPAARILESAQNLNADRHRDQDQRNRIERPEPVRPLERKAERHRQQGNDLGPVPRAEAPPGPPDREFRDQKRVGDQGHE